MTRKGYVRSTGGSKTSLRALSEIQALNTPSTCYLSKPCQISINMSQSNGLSNVIQDPVTEAEDMDYEFNPSNKRKISNTHTQRPNHAIQFNSQPFIHPVVITLVSEPKAFHLLSFVEKQLFTKELSAIIGPLSSNIKWSKSGELAIFPSSRKQKEQLLRLDLVKEFQIKSSVSRSELELRGIIHNVPLINTEEDLIQLLADQGVKSVRRFNKQGPDCVKIPLTTVALTFVSSTLPPEVVIAHELFRIKKYIPRPLICYKCWRLGHHESTCGNEQKCRSCAAPHDKNSNCTGTRCCATCGQLDHLAGMMSCPLYAERQEAIKYAYEQNISIPEAIRMLKVPTRPTAPSTLPSPLKESSEVSDLRKEINVIKTTLALLETKNQDDITNLEGKVAAVEVEIVTLQNQIKPLLSLPSTIDVMKVNTENGFTATLDKLNALTDFLKAGNLGVPPPSKQQQQHQRSTRTPHAPK